MKKEELLVERLMRYDKSEIYPFHMPGHKRSVNTFTEEFPNPYRIDITEIEGFDNLHHAEGILRNSMDWMAGVYGADRSYYLINGSSGGILSAISGICGFGGKIIMSRNCHKSVYHGVILNHLKTEYIYPQMIEKMWITGGICLKDVENALDKNPDASAVLVLSPTYDGIVSDISGIAELVHQKGIPLIVDEAHGAHFSFDKSEERRLFPRSAINCGADVVIQSLHKTLPAFTQTAVLHVKKDFVDIERLEWYLQVYQSSSPSYVLMAGMERCIFEMNEKGENHYREFDKRIRQLRNKLSEMRCLQLLDESVIGHGGVYDIDCSKIVVSCGKTFLSGEKLGRCLREQYGLEPEMCGVNYVVAITTFMDTEEGLQRLERAFLEIDQNLFLDNYNIKKIKGHFWQEDSPEICMTMSEAGKQKWERVRISDSLGRISAEFIYVYPPGIPIITPGEKISQNILNKINYYKRGEFAIQGMEDPSAEYLRVCLEGKM